MESAEKLEKELVARYGDEQRVRLAAGIRQVSDYWREEDGTPADFEEFVRENFAGDEETLDSMFDRFEMILEKINGSVHDMSITMRLQTDLDAGPILPMDRVFAGYDVGAHITDDLFSNKLAFVALLNFPIRSLEERLTDGKKWTRKQWAQARLAQRFSRRVPAGVNLELARAGSASDQYIADYNIWMHHLLDNDGKRLFPQGLRLLSHWNLRDELKANYGNSKDGPEKQKMIFKVMERIVDQTIPQVVINNPFVDWNPYTNEVWPAAVNDSGRDMPEMEKVPGNREPDTRYEILLGCFRASRMVDEYSPAAPSLIARRFEEDREIREKDVEKMLVDVLSSPLVEKVGELIKKRLGRDLLPYDIWYNGFKSTGRYSESELDDVVRNKYPTPADFEKDIPRFLRLFGFADEKADAIAENILVEAARGSGHASGGEMRYQPARLRTRVGAKGMDYKGFNIAVHELGHNVEQTIDMNYIDHTLLTGVPNTAFTEAFAYVFQENDLMLLGLDPGHDSQSDAINVISDFWNTYEIGGVSLVDMRIWRWMYAHPEATPSELKEASVRISKEVWNEYFAPVFGVEDIFILGVYSHIVHSFLYIPDYAIGHMIAFQVKKQMKKAGNIGSEFERMALVGNVAPDLWMINATGTPVGPQALLEATAEALKVVK
ncbi:MAG: hypothetical protein JW814_12590 [Candidatus Krumholzibacteriota bacterium]|nr:hypothetical protein [Candidatus Krumholzibacteriota bacterium]